MKISELQILCQDVLSSFEDGVPKPKPKITPRQFRDSLINFVMSCDEEDLVFIAKHLR